MDSLVKVQRDFLEIGMCVCLYGLGRPRALRSFHISALAVLCSPLFSYAQIQNSAVAFTAGQPVPGANACSNAFAGHFHRGARMDLVSTCTPGNFPGQGPFTAVLLNQGNGLFNPVEDSAIDGIASPVLAVDMNGDGLADLVVNQQFSATFGVQLSNGDGTFRAPAYYTPAPLATNAVLTAAASGDFNGDGKIDLAVITTVFTVSATVNSTNILTIFLNSGGGVLTQAASYTLDSIPANQNAPLLIAGELNNDNKADLAVVYRSATGEIVPYFATQGGQFLRGVIAHAGAFPQAAAIGKLTAGAYGDIVVSVQTGIAVMLGSGGGLTSGTFVPYPSPVPQFGDGAQLVLTDLDNDGILDLAVTLPDLVEINWGKGDGRFTSGEAYSVPPYPLALLAADLTGTGRKDLVSVGQDASLTVLGYEGSRSFRAAPNTYSPYAAGIVAGDFNHDGRQDIAVVNTLPCKAPCHGWITVFQGTGKTWFNAGRKYPLGMHGAAIAAGDLNGDGIPDLVVSNATAGDTADLSVFLGLKGGGFAAARNYTLGSLSNDVFLIDVNRDGKLDLVEDGGVALGKGDGTFGPLKPFPSGLAFGQPYPTAFSMHLAVGDLNGDGFPDVVASYVPPGMSPYATQVWALWGNGKGNFTAEQLYDGNLLVQQVVGVAIGKLGTGGSPDIVLANHSVDPSGGDLANAVIFAGNGKGSFQEVASPTATADAGSNGTVAIADFNHDGIPDIGIVSGDDFTVALGKRDGTFTTQVFPTFLVSSGTSTNAEAGLAVADFNGDGWPDIMFSNQMGIARLYNRAVPVVSPGSLTWAAGGNQIITVQNTLKWSQTMSAALADPAQSPFRVIANGCHAVLAAGAKCTVTVEYASSGTPATDTLYIRANGVFIAQVALNGN